MLMRFRGCHALHELRHEKTGHRGRKGGGGFQLGLTQTDLYSHRNEIEA